MSEALIQEHRAPQTCEGVDGSKVGEFGMWVFIASEALFFGALLVTYAYGRARWHDGFALASRQTDVPLGTLNTAILLTSSLLVALAVAAQEAKAERWAGRLLLATAALGATFLAIKGIEWRHEWVEQLIPGPAFRIDGNPQVPQGAQLFFAFYFVATGLHALHIVIGLGVMVWMHRALSRQRSSSPPSIELVGLYWHFVDVVWIVLFPLLYLVERHTR